MGFSEIYSLAARYRERNVIMVYQLNDPWEM